MLIKPTESFNPMRNTLLIVCSAIALATGAAAQADSFDSARSHLQARQNAEALAIIDSGEFEVNTQTAEGYTLLHYAAGAGNLEMVKALLARGADPTIKANMGYTPYQMAIGTMVQAEIRKAMKARANSPASAPPLGAPAATNPSFAQPSAAVVAQPGGLCEIVLADRANDGRSPAERPFLTARDAIWYNHPDELTGLIEDCVGVDQQDAYGWTLLHHAAQRDRVPLAKILIDHGAKRTVRNKDGETAAQLATSAEMKALLGPAPAANKPAGRQGDASATRKLECRQKYEADAALASDSTGRMSAMRRWQQCLNTGRYW